MLLLAVHHDAEGTVEADVAHKLGFLDGGHGVEDVLLQHAVAGIGVDGEVAHTERGEVLEEVGALRGVYVVVLQTGLDDDAGGGDVGPLDGDAQPVVAGAPAARPDEHVVLVVGQEAAVNLFYLVGYLRVVGCREVVVGLDIDHVDHILGDAMTQRVVRAQQTLLVGNGGQVFVEYLLGVDDRTNLQQVELAADRQAVALLQIAGEFYLDRAPHLLGAKLLRELQDFRQREHVVLQHAGEGDDLAASLVDAVADNLVVGVVGRGYAVERLVLVGLADAQVQNVETVVHLEVIAYMRHVEGIEARLRLLQRRVHLGGLQHLVGMVGRHTQRLSAVDDIFSQTEGQRRDAFLSQLVANGIIVQRAQHAREGGIEAGAILLAHHLLQDDGHLLLVDDIAGGSHIGLRVLIINGGIDALDGTGQHAQHLVLIVQIGYHIGGVDAGKGLVVGVLEQRRRADGDGRLHRIEEGEEVGYQRIGQLGTQEVLQDFLVGGIAQGNAPQVVLVHELVEEVGTEHDGLRYLDGGILKLVQLGMALDDVVQKRQATALAAQRALADAGEVGVAVELQTVEDSHDTDVLHAAILHDGVEDNLAVGVDILQLVPRNGLQELRHGEDGARTEPAAHVVARDVVEHRVVGNLEDVVLQLLQRRHAGNLLTGHRVAEDEVAKAHVLLDERAQVDIHLLRVLVYEVEVFALSFLLVGYLRALQDERHILVAATNLTEQLQSGLRVAFLHMGQPPVDTLQGETGIADDAQHVVGIHLVPVDGLLVGGSQHHLGTSALSLGSCVGIERLSREILRLRQDIIIKVRQHRRVEADIILNEQNHLYARLLDVMLDVHLVFYQLDDRQDEVRIAQPTEHVVENRHVLVLNALGDAMRERGQHDARHVGGHHLHIARHGEGIVVGIARHANHQVYVGGLQHVVSFLRRRHLGERGRVTQTQLHILVEDFLVYASVVLQHEGIVGVSHYQYIEDALRHQVDKRDVFQEKVVELLRDICCRRTHVVVLSLGHKDSKIA